MGKKDYLPDLNFKEGGPLETIPQQNLLEKTEDIIENLSNETTEFSTNEKFCAVAVFAIVIFIFIFLEAFCYTENIYSPMIRNILFGLSVIVLVTVSYAVLKFNKPEKLAKVGYLYLFYGLFAIFAMTAGRIGYGLAITTGLMMFLFIGLILKETKDYILIIPLAIIAMWEIYIVYHYITDIVL